MFVSSPFDLCVSMYIEAFQSYHAVTVATTLPAQLLKEKEKREEMTKFLLKSTVYSNI